MFYIIIAIAIYFLKSSLKGGLVQTLQTPSPYASAQLCTLHIEIFKVYKFHGFCGLPLSMNDNQHAYLANPLTILPIMPCLLVNALYLVTLCTCDGLIAQLRTSVACTTIIMKGFTIEDINWFHCAKLLWLYICVFL